MRDLIKHFPIRSKPVRQQWVRMGLGCPQCGGQNWLPNSYVCEDLNCLYNAAPLAMGGGLAQYAPERETEDA